MRDPDCTVCWSQMPTGYNVCPACGRIDAHAVDARLQFLEGAVVGMMERLTANEAAHAADKAALAQGLRALADALTRKTG